MKNSPSQAVAAELRAYALSFPGATEEFPWGESAFKVNGKVFVFMRAHAEGLHLSMKLPQSNATALDKDFAQPTGYGLGKSGWVTCTFEGGERVPVDVIKPWIVESWRAVAPKTLVKKFDVSTVVTSSAPTPTPRSDSASGSDSSRKLGSSKAALAKPKKTAKTGAKQAAKKTSSATKARVVKSPRPRARKRT